MDVPDSLRVLLDDGVIDAVHTRLMTGKEASAFVVERRGELIAAKVYKERTQRSFKATANYMEGRNQTRNTRDKRAMNKRTRYGTELIEQSWRDMEYTALQAAWQAGVRVPEPILLYEDVLLMELLVDENGAPAPRLADFELPADIALLLHREIYGQVRLLLASGRVHGDLSAFNVLIARDGPTLIDLPQVVDAAANSNAAAILQRDLQNITDHLARFAPSLALVRDCGVPLWRHFQRGTLERALEPEVVMDAHPNAGPPRVAHGQQGPRDHRRPPRDARGFSREDRGPPRDPRGHPREDRGPPRDPRGHSREDRGPPRDPNGPQRDSRGPPHGDRGPPRDRSAHPSGPQEPPRHHRERAREHRGPPRDHKGPPRDRASAGPTVERVTRPPRDRG